MKKPDPSQKLFPFAQKEPAVIHWDDLERFLDAVNPVDCEGLIAPMRRIEGIGIIVAASEQVYRDQLQAVRKSQETLANHLKGLQALKDW